MKIRSMFTILAAVLILAVGSISLTAAPAPQAEQAAAGDAQITLTGCLEGAAGPFTLTTEGGEKYVVMGSEELAKHVGHTVKITGTKGDDPGKLTVKAAKIEQISTSCAG
jgi:hypothetical protein